MGLKEWERIVIRDAAEIHDKFAEVQVTIQFMKSTDPVCFCLKFDKLHFDPSENFVRAFTTTDLQKCILIHGFFY